MNETQTHRSVGRAGQTRLLSRLSGLVLGQACLEFSRRLDLGFLCACSSLNSRDRSGIARGGASLSLGSKELVADALVVLLQNIVRNTLHAKDLDIWGGAIG